MYTIDGIVRDLLQQLKDHSEYNYVSVTDLIHDAGIDFDQIDFMDLFRMEKLELDYHSELQFQVRVQAKLCRISHARLPTCYALTLFCHSWGSEI